MMFKILCLTGFLGVFSLFVFLQKKDAKGRKKKEELADLVDEYNDIVMQLPEWMEKINDFLEKNASFTEDATVHILYDTWQKFVASAKIIRENLTENRKKDAMTIEVLWQDVDELNENLRKIQSLFARMKDEAEEYQRRERLHARSKEREGKTIPISMNGLKTSYFFGCRTRKELRGTYRRLVKKYHPDNGGDKEKFDEVQKQYEEAKKTL